HCICFCKTNIIVFNRYCGQFILHAEIFTKYGNTFLTTHIGWQNFIRNYVQDLSQKFLQDYPIKNYRAGLRARLPVKPAKPETKPPAKAVINISSIDEPLSD